MPQSIFQHYSHLIFSTKHRTPWITASIEQELWAYMGGVLNNLNAPPILIGGRPDHVHLLYRLPKELPVPKQIEILKKDSSKWIKTKGSEFREFYWQRGYGSFSVCPSILEKVKRYIINQEAHHRSISFQEEYRRFLNEYGVEYDERYVWD